MIKNGFTLIELMITVAILGIITAIAWPQFEQQSMKNRRSIGISALLIASNELQKCHSDVGGYTDRDGTACSFTKTTERGYYVLDAMSISTDAFKLRATAQGLQAKDLDCTTLTLNHLGQKGYTGAAAKLNRCWSN